MDRREFAGGVTALAVDGLCLALGFCEASVLWLLAIAIVSTTAYSIMLPESHWPTGVERRASQIHLVATLF